MKLFRITNPDGSEPDLEQIAITEDWANCYMECFAVDEDGELLLLDECGGVAYPPEGRFRVELLK